MSKDIQHIEMLQHKAVRFISNLKGVCKIHEEIDSLRLDSLEKRRRDSRLRSLMNILQRENQHKELCKFYENQLSTKNNIVTRAAAQSLPRAPSVNKTVFQKSFMIRTMKDMRLPTGES